MLTGQNQIDYIHFFFIHFFLIQLLIHVEENSIVITTQMSTNVCALRTLRKKHCRWDSSGQYRQWLMIQIRDFTMCSIVALEKRRPCLTSKLWSPLYQVQQYRECRVDQTWQFRTGNRVWRQLTAMLGSKIEPWELKSLTVDHLENSQIKYYILKL